MKVMSNAERREESRKLRDSKRGEIRRLIERGEYVKTIARKIGVAASVVYRVIEEDGLQHLRKSGRPTWEKDWQKLPATMLTSEQLARAAALRIEPERFAWLLACPRLGNPRGYLGGNSIG